MSQERNVKIAIGQIKVAQGGTKENLEKMVRLTREAADAGATIIAFPELAYNGYHLEAGDMQKTAEDQNGPMVQTLRKVAKEKGVYILAGYAESVEIPGRMYNSAVFIDDKGELIGNMRKVNAWGVEKNKFREGNKFPVWDTPIGKIGLMICYDIEFPEPARIMALKGAELVFVLSVWSVPAARRWELDVPANALFNVMFIAGANPVGDGSCGDSMVAGPNGVIRARASSEEEELLFCDIDLNEVIEERSRLPYLNDFKEDTFSMDAVEKY